MRLIDADALKKTFEELHLHPDLIELIDNAPSVPLLDFKEGYKQAIIDGKTNFPRPQGKWIKITKNGTIPVEYICSVCGRKIFDNYELSVPQSVYYPFCHCGADMRGEEE